MSDRRCVTPYGTGFVTDFAGGVHYFGEIRFLKPNSIAVIVDGYEDEIFVLPVSQVTMLS